MPRSAYTLRCLRDMGITIGDLGCVMLDVNPFAELHQVLPEEWAYRSRHPDLGHVSGIQRTAHVTLLYGLLSNAHTIRGAVDEVMDGWSIDAVEVDHIAAFASPIKSEPYACIVAKLVHSEGLLDAHTRLSMLPHIDTHPTYQPHITLAYVHLDYEAAARGAIERELGDHARQGVIGLNYGDEPNTEG